MNRRNLWAIIQKHIFWLIILCLPLFFINIRDNHDWGGDFAQYLAQADNIANGIPHWKTNYVFNPDAAVYGPAAYPPGYPLLLSPVIKIFGLDFKVLMIWQSLFLLLLGVSSFFLFKNTFGKTVSLLLVLLIVYHPWILQFKAELMSDIVFANFFILTLVLYNIKNKRSLTYLFMISFMLAFLPFIRTIGLVLILAVLFDGLKYLYLYYINKKKDYHLQKNFHIKLIILTALFFIFIKYILFPTPVTDSESYALIFNPDNLLHTIFKNLSYYYAVLINHFSLTKDNWLFISVITYSFVISFFVLGFILKSIKQFRFSELLFLLYIGVLIVYPYQGSGFRFLLPVFPLIIYYVFYPFIFFRQITKLRLKLIIMPVVVFILLLYMNGIFKIVRQQQMVVEGPQKAEAQELFSYIRQNTPKEASIAFIKPRVLAYFTGRKSLGTWRGDTQEELEAQYDKFDVDYLLWFNLAGDENFEEYILLNHEKLEKVFENRNFRLYKFKS